MFRKGKGGNSKHSGHQLVKDNKEECICSMFGYSISHQRGVPCFTLICPTCKIPMTRRDNSDNKLSKNEENVNLKARPYPAVDIELCAGCGACVNECLSDAIILVDNKAKIINEKCINCRACIDACPVEAIT